MNPNPQTVPVDHLDRSRFLNALEANIETLAKVPSSKLATPRVIAVDAKWGNGKTWIAAELARRLRSQVDRKVVSVDVFRYDHHDDPFSVIASAIYAELRPTGQAKSTFLSAAGAVLKSAAPIAAKAALSLGAKAIGVSLDRTSETVSEAIDGAEEAVGDFSEKAIEKLFASYSNTERVQAHFIAALSNVTEQLAQPLVVIVDELDRCRPSFALEVLERIKHLFGAENVVFVLFWSAAPIHESIRHTYGPNTDAAGYLGKFVAFSIQLELEWPRGSAVGRRFANFINAKCDMHFASANTTFDFKQGLMEASGVLDPSLRHVEKVIQLAAQMKIVGSDQWPTMSAYLLLLKTMDEERFAKVVKLDGAQAAFEAQLFREAFANHEGGMNIMHAILAFCAERQRYEELVRSTKAATGSRIADLPRSDIQVLEGADDGNVLPMFQRHANLLLRTLTVA